MIARYILKGSGPQLTVLDHLTSFDFFNDYKDTEGYLASIAEDDGSRFNTDLRHRAAMCSRNLKDANSRWLRNTSDTVMAEAEGWTRHFNRENGVTSYRKDGDRIWMAGARRLYVRAAFSENKFTQHRSFDDFASALRDEEGERFGPSW